MKIIRINDVKNGLFNLSMYFNFFKFLCILLKNYLRKGDVNFGFL